MQPREADRMDLRSLRLRGRRLSGRVRRPRPTGARRRFAGGHPVHRRPDRHDGPGTAVGRGGGGAGRDDSRGRIARGGSGPPWGGHTRRRVGRAGPAARFHRRARALPGGGARTRRAVAAPAAGRRRREHRRRGPQDPRLDRGTGHPAGRPRRRQRLRRLAARRGTAPDARRPRPGVDRAPDSPDPRLGTPAHRQLRGAGGGRGHRRDARSAGRTHPPPRRLARAGRCARGTSRRARRGERPVLPDPGRDRGAGPPRGRRVRAVRHDDGAGRLDRLGNDRRAACGGRA